MVVGLYVWPQSRERKRKPAKLLRWRALKSYCPRRLGTDEFIQSYGALLQSVHDDLLGG